jgi:imipenem/basic amino acid-specific outer membrane pore
MGTATVLAMSSVQSFAADLVEADFFKNSKLTVLNRNFYFDRDFTSDRAKQSARREWGQGLIGTFSSGYTPGLVGFGVDATGMYGLKLDSSSDRVGSGLFPTSGSGTPGVDHSQDEYSKGIAAIKLKVSAP